MKSGISQNYYTNSSYATQGAVLEGRRIIETALETVYNGGEGDETYQKCGRLTQSVN